MNSETTYVETHRANNGFSDALSRNRSWYRTQGILFIVAGILALVVPTAAVLGMEMLLAALLILSGGYQAYQGAMDRSGWLTASGLLSLIVGLTLVFMPIAGAIALATLIALFLMAEGVVEIFFSLQLRSSPQWKWLLISGILSLLLGVLLLVGWPAQTLALAGILLGINFLAYGAAILALTQKATA